MSKRKLDDVMTRAIDAIVPLETRVPKQHDLPIIVNQVASVSLLPQTKDKRYKFSLEAISMGASGISQFAPCKFAATVLRLRDSGVESTALVFRSGKMVVGHCLTKEHVRYMSQLFRLVVERFKCVMFDRVTGQHVYCDLQNRTVFENCIVYNVVGWGNLGVPVDLVALRDMAQHCVRYEEGGFPGAKFKVWLTKGERCTCQQRKDVKLTVTIKGIVKRKCECKCECLIFKTGNLVITGARNASDVNSVFYRIKGLLTNIDYTERPFHQRLGELLQKGMGIAVKKVARKETVTDSEAIAIALTTGANLTKRLKVSSTNACDSTFINFCDRGQLSNVKTLLAIQPDVVSEVDDEGQTALERLLARRATDPNSITDNHEKIIDMLLLNQ